jgi:hypothetical protein
MAKVLDLKKKATKMAKKMSSKPRKFLLHEKVGSEIKQKGTV